MIRKPFSMFLGKRVRYSLPMALSLSLLLPACSSSPLDELEGQEQQALCELTVTIDGLDVTTTPFTRTAAAEAKITHITLTAFDAAGSEAFTLTHTSADANFGTITTKVPVGEYTFVAVAHKSPEGAPAATIASLTQASVTGYTDLLTYSCTQAVSISGNTTQSVTLNMGKRKNATLTLTITDPTPAEVESLQMIVSPSATVLPDAVTFDPATGFATNTWRYERTIAKENGTFTGTTYGLPILLADTEQQLDVTFNALDVQGNILYSRTKTAILFQQAAYTKVSGTFFSSATAGSFDFDTSLSNIPVSLD